MNDPKSICPGLLHCQKVINGDAEWIRQRDCIVMQRGVRKERNGISTERCTVRTKNKIAYLSQKKRRMNLKGDKIQQRNCQEWGELNYHVSAGGLDSIVLYLFLHDLY
ncbi:MAG: hypothetical protein ACLT46_16100 [Hungatella sp.]